MTAEGLADQAFGDVAEATVVGRAQDGDLDAFESLVRHYQGPLFRLALRLMRDRGDAEDALQDAMVQVWRKLPALDDPQAFRRWIYQIMTRRCMSVLRTRTRQGVQPAQEDELDMALTAQRGTGEDPAVVAAQRAQLRDLNDALALLPEDQRVCWVMRELHELSYAEIAFATNLTEATVRGRLMRARRNLLKGMDAWR
ncbi:RNA polymerase sigma factor [Bogoriella caseilytica]|uniref:RNA polymerase sigma-70 factor (ECF subfamily) n=1 Tax=Bogoriella caseilytica TaxID=56055 RepID=A0A3N2BE18_9MICO|nr:sigma-70 family RNA polymerase sigma factor [Bogoriella caseilytica]ROR73496.1 RNA polymerase sigma-70 factor (ECF subfamily) [Bogoriella caseilytica]